MNICVLFYFSLIFDDATLSSLTYLAWTFFLCKT